jgi:hypothetical protein
MIHFDAGTDRYMLLGKCKPDVILSRTVDAARLSHRLVSEQVRPKLLGVVGVAIVNTP